MEWNDNYTVKGTVRYLKNNNFYISDMHIYMMSENIIGNEVIPPRITAGDRIWITGQLLIHEFENGSVEPRVYCIPQGVRVLRRKKASSR